MGRKSAVRSALEERYIGKCIITEHQSIIDPKTHIMGFQDAVVGQYKCRLSYKSSPPSQDGNTAKVDQTIKLFLAPEVRVKPGSKITVTQNGRQEDYQGSGIPAVYENHQEIILEAFQGWA